MKVSVPKGIKFVGHPGKHHLTRKKCVASGEATPTFIVLLFSELVTANITGRSNKYFNSVCIDENSGLNILMTTFRCITVCYTNGVKVMFIYAILMFNAHIYSLCCVHKNLDFITLSKRCSHHNAHLWEHNRDMLVINPCHVFILDSSQLGLCN